MNLIIESIVIDELDKGEITTLNIRNLFMIFREGRKMWVLEKFSQDKNES